MVEAMKELAGLVTEGRECLLNRDYRKLSKLMDRNFDIRSSICKLDPRNVEMVCLARNLGVCATYAGSGGSIVGICESERDLFAPQRRIPEAEVPGFPAAGLLIDELGTERITAGLASADRSAAIA